MKKLKRTVKRLLKIPYTKQEQDDMLVHRIEAAGRFEAITRQANTIHCTYKGKHQLHARLSPHSDALVLEQVLVAEEYKPVTDFFIDNFPGSAPLRIIDAGANVGYSSLFFLSALPGSTVACVEPDEKNLAMLRKNLAPFIDAKQVHVFQNGLMSSDGDNIVTSNDFRDGKDWSVSVVATEEESTLKSISVEGIRRQMDWEQVDILKIDIEGAERFVFAAEADPAYLARVRVVAIEIHDEFDIRDTIYTHLKNYGFTIFNFAQTTMGVNKKLLHS